MIYCFIVEGIDYTDMSFVITEVHRGKYGDGCGDPWEDQDLLLTFSLSAVFLPHL